MEVALNQAYAEILCNYIGEISNLQQEKLNYLPISAAREPSYDHRRAQIRVQRINLS